MATVDIVLKGVDNASGVIKGVGGALGGLADIAGGAFNAAMGIAAAGVTALGAGLAYSIGQAMDAEKVMAQTEAVIKSTGGASGMTAGAIADLATSLSTSSTFADDAIQSAENLLLTFTNIGKDTFPMATQAMVDMAAAMGTDVSAGAIQLGKALNDPVEGISALSRVGVTFTEEQKAMIKSMVEMGDTAGAQAVILAELNKEFGGSALAQSQTFGGQLEQIKNQFDGMAETVGMALLPILSELRDSYLNPLIITAYELSEAFAAFVDLARGGDLESAIGVFGEWDSIREVINFLGIDIYGLAASVDDLVTAFGALLSGNSSLEFFSIYLLKIADEYLPGLREQFQPLVLAVVGLGEAFAASLPLAQLYVELFVAFITEQFQMLGPQLTENLTATITTLTELWQKYGDDIMRIVTIAFSFLAVTIGGTLLIVSGIITTFLQVLNGDWTGAWQTIQDTTATFMNMVLALVGQDLATFTAIWSTNWANFLTIVTFILESIGQGVIDFGTFVAAQFTGILNTLLGIAGTFSSVGSAIIDGITAGVNGAVGGLIAAAVGAVNSAVGAAKSALGIQSPSTVFASMGENMMAGMAQGLQSGTPVAAQASVAAAQQVTSTTNNYTLQMANYGGKPSIPDLFQQQQRAIAGAW